MEPVRRSEAAAKVIRELLAKRQMTIQYLSDSTAIPYVTLHRRLSGTSPMNTRELYLIANVLGLSGSEILATAEAAA
jgi:predicted transcriptional regulator